MTDTIAEEQIRSKRPLHDVRELWKRTVGVEVVQRLDLEAVVRAGPYKDISDAPEPPWQYVHISVACKCGLLGEGVEDVVSAAHDRMREVLKKSLGDCKAIRIHPRRAFKMSPFALETLDDGTQQWHATVLLAFQRVPVADIHRIRGEY